MSKKVKILPADVGYNLAAGSYDEREKYLNSFEKDKLLSLLGNLSGLKVLDAGAGTGRLAVKMAKLGARVTALDVSEKMLAVLRKKVKVATVVGEVDNLPFADEVFDWVIAAFLIVHLKDPARFFDEAYRALKEGGRLLITNINQKEPPEIKTQEGPIKIESYYHRPEKIRQQLEKLAFTVEQEILVKEGENWVNQIIVARK